MSAIEKIKEVIAKRTYLKALLSVLLLAILGLYFKAFFTTGVYFDETFLRKEIVAGDTHYRGKAKAGPIHITVKDGGRDKSEVDVIYKLPNNIYKEYTISFKSESHQVLSLVTIKGEDGNVVFEGEYHEDAPFLFNKQGEPIIKYTPFVDGQVQYDSSYEIPLKSAVDFGAFTNETIRGDFGFLICAMMLFILTAIDMKYPRFFFMFNNFLHVKNPEPSDFYISMQRMSWYMYPIIGIILMIAAIF